MISIHALVKRATNFAIISDTVIWHFNPRPREEGDLTLSKASRVSSVFQSTPSWRGRHNKDVHTLGRWYISIHALVKRATFCSGCYADLNNISIHALVKRATNQSLYRRPHRWYFNPRPREEGDHKISRCASSKMDFNPRPREEGDINGRQSIRIYVYFNPRPREEGDTGIRDIHWLQKYFNPRPREEGDKKSKSQRKPITISIHALVKRATT